MHFKLTRIAILTSALFGLAACSGGSNQSTPTTQVSPATQQTPAATVVNTVEEPKKEATKEESKKDVVAQEKEANKPEKRKEIEHTLDPAQKVKWRQLAGFVFSSDTYVDNPNVTAGNISPQDKAAAYTNGQFVFVEGGVTKDLKNAADRAESGYDQEFLTKAEIARNKLQHYSLKNKDGKKLANVAFVNQQYSSYLTWKSEVTPIQEGGVPLDDVAVGYLAVPTPADRAMLEKKVKATYKGHAIINKRTGSNALNFSDVQLDADFQNMTISGKITNRNDNLLDASAKRHSDLEDHFTTDAEAAAEDPTLKLITEAEMAAKWEAEFAPYRTLDVNLQEAPIKLENGVVSFRKATDGMQYSINGKIRTSGNYGGIFAGSEAQEVVGEIQAGDSFVSFGATEAP